MQRKQTNVTNLGVCDFTLFAGVFSLAGVDTPFLVLPLVFLGLGVLGKKI